MHFHEWGKWQTYEKRGTFIPYKDLTKEFETCEVRQRRECQKCGRTQDELITDGPLVPDRRSDAV